MAAKDDEPEWDWTKGLPSKEELTPLSHSLISRNLANAFRMKYDDPMTEEDVRRESKATFHNIFNQKPPPSFDPVPAFQEQENTGGFGYGVEGRRVEQEARGNRAEDEFRGEFRGNVRAEERRDGRAHAVVDRMDCSGSFGSEIPRQRCASGNDSTGLGKGGVKKNAGGGGAGLQGVQGSATNTATHTGREYGNGSIDMNTNEMPVQPPSPGRTNGVPYEPYQERREDPLGQREDETSPGGQGSAENGRKAADFEREDGSSAGGAVSSEDPNENSKRPARIVWTPQLHKRFVEAVGHLGIKSAVPKTIMQLMNVEGLTRENVASHLQKYRLHLKRMQAGHFNDGCSASDYLFSTTPLPPGMRPHGMSPHFIPFSSNREDGGAPGFTTPVIPMPFQGLVRPGPFGGFEHMSYGHHVAGGFMPRPPMPDPRMAIPEHSAAHSRPSQSQQNHPSLSSQGVLPLFPTNRG